MPHLRASIVPSIHPDEEERVLLGRIAARSTKRPPQLAPKRRFATPRHADEPDEDPRIAWLLPGQTGQEVT